jgi:hypothetical protein
MAKADVDVTLIELDDIPDSNFRVYYSGWDRSGTAPPGAVGIHHPGGFEKCISFANGPLSTGDNCIGGTGINTHWQVTWDAGVTEPGSSGSGIWDPSTHRLVGTLSGGGSDCSTPFDSDCYGKFSLAWNSGTTPATRLRDWLDPANTGVSTMGGRDPQPVLIVSAGSSLFAEGCSPTNGVIDPNETVTVSFSFQNIGASNSVNLTATLLATNGVTSPSAPQNYGVVVANGAAVARSFSFVASGTCGGVITPTLQLQDGTNNFGPFTFPFRLGTPLVTFTQNFDAVSIPGLPTGWSNAASGSTGWRTVASPSHTTPNSVFSADPANLSDAALTSPLIPISSPTAQVKFAHSYNTESGSEPFDGGVLEISYNNGPFNDIIAAGGSFFSGGYNGVISTRYSSPIAGRRAWSGNSGGFVTTIANLPITAAGQNIRLRWRMVSDSSQGATGWNVDTISIIDGYSCCHTLVPPQIVDTRIVNTNLAFSFNTVAGQTYVVEYQNVLATNLAWTPFQTNTGDGLKKSVTNLTGAATSRFYRVETQ